MVLGFFAFITKVIVKVIISIFICVFDKKKYAGTEELFFFFVNLDLGEMSLYELFQYKIFTIL